MSLLYKPKEKQSVMVDISSKDGKVIIDFYSDCGKFGAEEMLSGYILTPERLLEVMQSFKDYKDEEL